MRYLDDSRVTLKYKLPLSEVVEDFYDHVKSLSSGYATFDYEEAGYEESSLVKLQLMLNGEPVDALSSIAHASRAFTRGKAVCKRLKDTIPRSVCGLWRCCLWCCLARGPVVLAGSAEVAFFAMSFPLPSSTPFPPAPPTAANCMTLPSRPSAKAAWWPAKPSRPCGRT